MPGEFRRPLWALILALLGTGPLRIMQQIEDLMWRIPNDT